MRVTFRKYKDDTVVHTAHLPDSHVNLFHTDQGIILNKERYRIFSVIPIIENLNIELLIVIVDR